jgi:hypothetical protein
LVLSAAGCATNADADGATEGQDVAASLLQYTNGFEGADASAWWVAGNAGVDVGLGNALDNANNGWVRAFSGWNAINTTIPTVPGAHCWLQVWIRTSSDLSNGYITVRESQGVLSILKEVGPFGAWPGDPNRKGYNFVPLDFDANSSDALFYVGLWGNGQDSWIQADDLTVQCYY